MNVLQVLPELGAGGVERTTIEIAQALKAQGHVPHVAALGGRLQDELTSVGGILHEVNVGSKNPLALRRNTRTLIKIIKDHKIDIVHARSRAPAWPASAAAKASGTAFITTYHGIYNARSRLKRRYNAVMTKGDIIIANSKFTKAHIIAEHGTDPESIRVIARGVDMARFDPAKINPQEARALRAQWGVEPEENLVLLPGRLTRWKGQLVAVEALAGLEETKLVLLGDAQGRDDFVEEIKVKAEALGLLEKLVLVPHTNDMPLALAAADCVISASTDPEAFGRVMAEAQAMQKLVVATNHGGACETIKQGEGGVLVQPGNAQALAAAIKSLLGLSKKTYAARGQKARAWIESEFSDTKMQEATLAVYKEVLKQHD